MWASGARILDKSLMRSEKPRLYSPRGPNYSTIEMKKMKREEDLDPKHCFSKRLHYALYNRSILKN